MNYIGDFPQDQTIYHLWSTNTSAGASVTRATDGTVAVYKDNGETQVTTGLTDDEDFDTTTGIHMCIIVTTNAWYAPAHDYFVVLTGATIDGQTASCGGLDITTDTGYSELTIKSGSLHQYGGNGYFRLGSLLAYAVEVLDGVDGKLARTRLQFSRLGEMEHVFDFFMEQAWYLCITLSLYAGTGNQKLLWVGIGLMFVAHGLPKVLGGPEKWRYAIIENITY